MKPFRELFSYEGSQKWLRAGVATACVVVLLTVLFQSRQKRLVPSNTVPQITTEIPNAPSAGAPSPSIPNIDVANTEKTKAPLLAKTATSVAIQSSRAGLAAHTMPELTKTVGRSKDPVAAEPVNAVQRPYIAEWPESGFQYPIAPSATLIGTVTLNAVIGIDGTVTNVEVVSGNRSLARAAVEAVRRWRYAAHKINGNTVEAETRIVIDFRGEDAVAVRFPTAN